MRPASVLGVHAFRSGSWSPRSRFRFRFSFREPTQSAPEARFRSRGGPRSPLQSTLRYREPRSPASEKLQFREPTQSAFRARSVRSPRITAPFRDGPSSTAPRDPLCSGAPRRSAPVREPTEPLQEPAQWPSALPAPPWPFLLCLPHHGTPVCLFLLDIFFCFSVCGASGIRSLKGELCHGPAGVPGLATRCLCVLSTWRVVCCWCHVLPCLLSAPLPSC